MDLAQRLLRDMSARGLQPGDLLSTEIELAQQHVQGLCAIGACLEPYRSVLNDTPLVSSCTFYPLTGPWVGQDVHEACRTSIAHLLSRGHREIAMVCSAGIDQQAFAIFVAGY